MAKVCAILYIHSERGDNNFIRGYCHAINKILSEDKILAEMCIKINGDNPKYNRWLQRNNAGINVPNPGFIIRMPKCAQNSFPDKPILLGVGFATQVFEVAYAVYKIVYGKDPGEPPQIYTKPPVLETDEISALASALHSLPTIIGKDD